MTKQEQEQERVAGIFLDRWEERKARCTTKSQRRAAFAELSERLKMVEFVFSPHPVDLDDAIRAIVGQPPRLTASTEGRIAAITGRPPMRDVDTLVAAITGKPSNVAVKEFVRQITY